MTRLVNGSIPALGAIVPSTLGAVDVVGGEVGQGPAAAVLELDLTGVARPGRAAGVAAV